MRMYEQLKKADSILYYQTIQIPEKRNPTICRLEILRNLVTMN